MEVEVNNVITARASKKFIVHILQTAYAIAKPRRRIDNISVALVDNITIKKLNSKYRKHDRVTDVLSFDDPYEIVICWKQLVKNAKNNKTSQKKELALLLVHGLLHMLRYDHKTKKQEYIMQQLTNKILQKLQI